jgi:hypothetical protein
MKIVSAFVLISCLVFASCLIGACASTAPETKPFGCTLRNTERGGVEVSWTERDGFDRYAIYRDGQLVEKVHGNRYVDDAVMPDSDYTYRVVPLRKGE